MPKSKWFNREVFGWAMFDFANQAFTMVILTSIFGLYFIYHIVPNNESLGRQLWATSGISALSIVIVVSPLIGALADFSGAKKRLLFTTYVVSVVFTAQPIVNMANKNTIRYFKSAPHPQNVSHTPQRCDLRINGTFFCRKSPLFLNLKQRKGELELMGVLEVDGD